MRKSFEDVILRDGYYKILNNIFYQYIIDMPIRRGKDSEGSYFVWGSHGKRYYYIPGDKISTELAYKKAQRQATAAYAHGWREAK
jgi:hypothetical protein